MQEDQFKLSTVVENLTMLAQANPLSTILELMGEHDDWMEMANNAANHLAVTLAHSITHPGGMPGGEAAGAAAITAALTVKQVKTWMTDNPEEGKAIESAISQHLKTNGLTEEHFNRRKAEENFQAVNDAGCKLPDITGTLTGPPAETIDGLDIIVRHAGEEQEDIRATAESNPGLYFHDNHYDQFQTFTWAWVMATAARNTSRARRQ